MSANGPMNGTSPSSGSLKKPRNLASSLPRTAASGTMSQAGAANAAKGEARKTLKEVAIMTHETREKIRILAGEALAYFEHRERHDGTKYWAVEDGAPEWVRKLAFVAHGEGKILPDDARYLFIVEALEALAENPDEPEGLLEPETYTSRLLKWLEASPSYRAGL